MRKKLIALMTVFSLILAIAPTVSFAYEWDYKTTIYNGTVRKPSTTDMQNFLVQRNGWYFYEVSQNHSTNGQNYDYWILASPKKLTFTLSSDKRKLTLSQSYVGDTTQIFAMSGVSSSWSSTLDNLSTNGWLVWNISLGTTNNVYNWRSLGQWTDQNISIPYSTTSSFIWLNATDRPTEAQITDLLTNQALGYFVELNDDGTYYMVSSDKPFSVSMANKEGYAYRGYHTLRSYTDTTQLLYVHTNSNGVWTTKKTTVERALQFDISSASHEQTWEGSPFLNHTFSMISDYSPMYTNSLYTGEAPSEDEDSTQWGIFSTLGEIFEVIKYSVNTMADFFYNFFFNIGDTLFQAFSQLWDFLSNFFFNLGDALFQAFSDLWDFIAGFFDKIGQVIGDIFKPLFDFIATFFENIWNGLTDLLKLLFIPSEGFYTSQINGFKDYADEKFGGILSIGETLEFQFNAARGNGIKEPYFPYKGKDIMSEFKEFMNMSVDMPTFGTITVIEFVRKVLGYLLSFGFILWLFTKFGAMIKGEVKS